ncbi:MAG: SRPBCC family protein [bacterium]|nr:SRPBCC family protein [bacterium]
MTPTPTGRVERRGENFALILSRTFDAPIEEVWASVTESDRLARWIGTWEGNPADGVVDWTMTAEGVTTPEPMRIRECTPPHSLKVTAESPMGHWPMEIELKEVEGGTTLTFTHTDVHREWLGSIGAGWEYYLDRLVAAETGGDVAAIDFERDYFPSMGDHFSAPED